VRSVSSSSKDADASSDSLKKASLFSFAHHNAKLWFSVPRYVNRDDSARLDRLVVSWRGGQLWQCSLCKSSDLRRSNGCSHVAEAVRAAKLLCDEAAFQEDDDPTIYPGKLLCVAQKAV
jgi:hypothetical protein